MQPYLNRQDYEDVVLRLKEYPDFRAPYPCTTGVAIVELRSRGLDADPASLQEYVREGRLPSPPVIGPDWAWSPANIDRAAGVYAEEGRLTPSFDAWDLWNVDPAAAIRARRRFEKENPDLSADWAEIVISPGLPGLEVAATIQYRRPSEEHLANLRAIVGRRQAAFLRIDPGRRAVKG